MAVASTVKRPPLETTSWSFIDTKPDLIKYDVKHTHVVTIGNINKKMEAEHGTVLQSKEFCIKIGDAITDWYIDIYPNGHDYDGSLKHIGIYLVRDTDTKFYSDANFILSLIDSNGSKRYSASYSLTLPQAGKKILPRNRTVGGTLGIVRNWEALFFNCLIKLPILDIVYKFLRCAR